MALMSTSCANLDQAADPQDPWEPFNRKVYAFNDFFDRLLLKPAARFYRWIMPEPAERVIKNLGDNLEEPVNLLNHLLQGEFHDAGVNFARFMINTSFGLGGLLDPASRLKLDDPSSDFGITLARWGVPPGPFVMLPFAGPNTVRSAAAGPVDTLGDPFLYVDDQSANASISTLNLLSLRADLLDVEKLFSGDRYLLIRDAWLQRRRAETGDPAPADDFGEDEFEEGFWEE